jgi:hypothetical protein
VKVTGDIGPSVQGLEYIKCSIKGRHGYTLTLSFMCNHNYTEIKMITSYHNKPFLLYILSFALVSPASRTMPGTQ